MFMYYMFILYIYVYIYIYTHTHTYSRVAVLCLMAQVACTTVVCVLRVHKYACYLCIHTYYMHQIVASSAIVYEIRGI
jgi:hypothetical protein